MYLTPFANYTLILLPSPHLPGRKKGEEKEQKKKEKEIERGRKTVMISVAGKTEAI